MNFLNSKNLIKTARIILVWILSMFIIAFCATLQYLAHHGPDWMLSELNPRTVTIAPIISIPSIAFLFMVFLFITSILVKVIEE